MNWTAKDQSTNLGGLKGGKIKNKKKHRMSSGRVIKISNIMRSFY